MVFPDKVPLSIDCVGLVMLQQEVNRFHRVFEHKGENTQAVLYFMPPVAQIVPYSSLVMFSITICSDTDMYI